MRIFLRLVAAVSLLSCCTGCVQAAPLRTSPLVIESASGVHHRFVVEIAETPAQRSAGLMFRRPLAANRGMLFDFHAVEPVSMWMKNTFFPLDMLFIDARGRIVSIVQHAVPLSLDTIQSGAPVRAALELNGGSVQRLGIRPGDRVLCPIFGRTILSRNSVQRAEPRREALQ